MDPVTIASLALAGIAEIQKIGAAMAALHEQRPTPEQVALLASIRAANQTQTDVVDAKLDAIIEGATP